VRNDNTVEKWILLESEL